MNCHIFAIIDHEGVPGEYSLNQREAEYGHWQQKRKCTHKSVAGPGHEGGIKLHWNYLLPVFGPLSQPQYVVVGYFFIHIFVKKRFFERFFYLFSLEKVIKSVIMNIKVVRKYIIVVKSGVKTTKNPQKYVKTVRFT